MPAHTTSAARPPWPVSARAAARPGKISENALAASIMPAAKPSMASSLRADTWRKPSASAAPNAVATAPASPPNTPSCQASGASAVHSRHTPCALKASMASNKASKPAASQGCWRAA